MKGFPDTWKKNIPVSLIALIVLLLSTKLLNDRSLAESGFPTFENAVSAEIYVYDDGGMNERLCVLDDAEFADLKRILMMLGAHGERVDADQLESQDGWPWKKFLVKMEDGREYQVKDVYQHVLIDDSHAWRASDHALSELANLYVRLIERYESQSPCSV